MIVVLGVMAVVFLLTVGFSAGVIFEWKYVNNHCVLFGKNHSR